MAVATLLVGFWVTARIEETVVRNSANASALFMESFIAPLSQDLANQRRMSRYARREFESLFRDTALGERVISYKIWARGGRIAEASDPDLVDRIFEPDDKLKLAWSGKVGAEFEELGGEESAAERKLGLPLLEVYTPIREQLSGRVIAVAEFYEINEQLAADLADDRADLRGPDIEPDDQVLVALLHPVASGFRAAWPPSFAGASDARQRIANPLE